MLILRNTLKNWKNYDINKLHLFLIHGNCKYLGGNLPWEYDIFKFDLS